jgi:hypothetical protein
VPITIHQVQTHIPVELIDVNRLRAKLAKLWRLIQISG